MQDEQISGIGAGNQQHSGFPCVQKFALAICRSASGSRNQTFRGFGPWMRLGGIDQFLGPTCWTRDRSSSESLLLLRSCQGLHDAQVGIVRNPLRRICSKTDRGIRPASSRAPRNLYRPRRFLNIFRSPV